MFRMTKHMQTDALLIFQNIIFMYIFHQAATIHAHRNMTGAGPIDMSLTVEEERIVAIMGTTVVKGTYSH